MESKIERVVTIDPGEHIGIVTYENNIIGGITLDGDYRNYHLWTFLNSFRPTKIVFEQFALRAKAASKLVGNKFVTCEVIGVIKLYSQMHNIPLVELQPINKEYCGFSSNPKDEHYKNIKIVSGNITEHVRDAYRLYNYYKLFMQK